MEKQKIVVKLSTNRDKKTRKALQVAVSISGVESVSLVGPDKDQIVVTGEGIDSIQLTTLLRKKVGYTELMSVGLVEEKKAEHKPTEAHPYEYYYYSHDMPYYYVYQN